MLNSSVMAISIARRTLLSTYKTRHSKEQVLFFIFILRCVLASLYVGVSVRMYVPLSVHPSVRPSIRLCLSVCPSISHAFVKSWKWCGCSRIWVWNHKYMMLSRSLEVSPSVSNAIMKWLETGIHGGSRACWGDDASMVCHT